MRHDSRVALERAIAEVAIFFASAVDCGVAFAVVLRAGLAGAVLTGVIHGASIAIVAGLAVQGGFAVLAA